MKCSVTVVVVAVVLLFSASVARAQKCPTWSPKFDKITNPDIIEKLKTFDWNTAISQAGGPEQVIASMKVTRKDAVQRLQIADHNAEETKGYPGPVNYNVTWKDCQDKNMGAHKASVCEHMTLTEMILYIDGSIDILKCYQDQR